MGECNTILSAYTWFSKSTLLEIEKSGELDKERSKELLVNTDPGVGQVLRLFEDFVIKVNKMATMSRQGRKDARYLCGKYSFAPLPSPPHTHSL